jgi:PBP1b-binding outer membrane lipoprotein LpoB
MRPTLTLALAAVLLAACSPASKTPTEQPLPAAPASTAPATPSTAPSPAVPTIARWVNVPCTPEGAKAKTNSGGDIVCKKVGSDKTPEWHAATP